MADESTSYRNVVDRRRFIELTGVSGAAALAGCDGSGGDDTPTDEGGSGEGQNDTESTDGTQSMDEDTETTGGDMEVIDRTLLGAENQDTSTIQYNKYNTSGLSDWSVRLVWDKMTQYYFHDADFHNYAISDWEVDGSEMTLKIREGLTWHNGDDVTAQDLVTKFEIENIMSGPIWDLIEGVEKDGDRTVVLDMGQKRNPLIMKHRINSMWFDVKHSEYKQFLDMNEDDAAAEIQGRKMEKPIGTGPFKVAESDGQSVVLERHDGHPDAGNINFSEFQFNYFDGNSAMQQQLLSQNIETVHSLYTPPTTADKYPDSVVEAQPASKLGLGLVPNHEDSDVGQREVRQAIMAGIDRKAAAEQAAPRTKKGVPTPSGLATQEQERFLGDELGTYDDYGDAARVEKLMKSAGYEMVDGVWGKDGEPMELPIAVPGGWSDWVAVVQVVVDQLKSHGFDAKVDSMPQGDMMSTVWPNGGYKLAAAFWAEGGARSTFPYFAYNYLFQNDHWPLSGSYGYTADEEKTLPSRTGDGEINITPAEELQKLTAPVSSDEATKITRNLAWICNQDLPMLQLVEKSEQTWLTENDEWSVPEEGSDIYKVRWPDTWLPRIGELRADQ